MTMLAMWLDDTSVALATDSKMTGTPDGVPKLHCVQPDKVMFGIGFGEGAFEWLIDCPCDKHPYPEHWRDCSQADNIDEFERIIRNDLQVGEFPPECHLELWLAGANEQGILEAFILDETGCRVSELAPGNVIFNDTIRSVSTRLEPIASIFGIQPTKPEPKQQFQALKKEMDDKQIEFSGAKALKEVSRQLIEFCEENNDPYIGGSLQYHVIFWSNVMSK